MSAITDARTIYGLQASATPAKTNLTGSMQIGVGQSQMRLTESDAAYCLSAYFAGSGDELDLDLTDNDTTGSTTWAAGTAQVETATAAGTVSTAGNATVIVTAAGMTGSPKTISVAVALSDTASLVAEKIRTALAADTAVSALFTVSGATSAIILTRKPTTTFSTIAGDLNVFPANDATLNISIDNGTCAGLTPATTSTDTTAGVATDGVKIYDGDGKDFQGVTIAPITPHAILVQNTGASAISVAGGTDEVFPVQASGLALFSCASGLTGFDTVQTFTAAGTTELILTVVGKTA